ncbi:ABC transporter, substrate-binding protein (cluster 8, B12/iron complex) [hydrothermal vent metagenome]|uniref:ABC transporter, substrate-binding protein (Cluster 8, B12/iron complex) n=1 Tax=hydrothermal vent metagenome TaxID=652676 RepID=A0A3B0YR43_9ZZZZ
MIDYYPKRIVCLTDETTEMLYLLGQQDRIVGISGYSVRPPQARKEKPRICAFTSAKIDKILNLEPDLVLGFSDLQADIAAELIRHGINVHVFNQRSIAEIFGMILTLGAMVGCEQDALAWVNNSEQKLASIKQAAANIKVRPVVYFEEWYDPIITGIRWVSELIEIAGGKECYPELSSESLAKNRIIADPLEVAARKPDIIIGSWCGRKFRPEHALERKGWEAVPAVVNKQIYEIKSANILQPGPAALTVGIDQIKNIIDQWQASF